MGRVDLNWRRTALLTALVACVAVPLFPLSFAPMLSEIDLQDGQGRARFTVRNEYGRPVAVQIEARTREIDIHGNEGREPTDALAVYPTQLVLDAGERQQIAVEWLEGRIDKERAFRVIAEEVPVDLEDRSDSRARLRMNMRYVTSLYIRPEGAAPDIRITEAKVVGRSEVEPSNGDEALEEPVEPAETAESEESAATTDGPFAEIRLDNQGTSRATLGDLKFVIAPAGDADRNGDEKAMSVTVDGSASLRGSQVVLAGAQRRILLPLPEHFSDLSPETPLEVEVKP